MSSYTIQFLLLLIAKCFPFFLFTNRAVHIEFYPESTHTVDSTHCKASNAQIGDLEGENWIMRIITETVEEITPFEAPKHERPSIANNFTAICSTRCWVVLPQGQFVPAAIRFKQPFLARASSKIIFCFRWFVDKKKAPQPKDRKLSSLFEGADQN